MAVTPNYGIGYPDGSSELTPLHTWFQTVAEGVDTALVTALSGLVGSGTTAQRDIVFPTPGTAAARVSLAAKPARWFNTEKGWEEQYFAGEADAGAGRFAKTVPGWYPSVNVGRVPIRPGSIAVTGGSGSMNGGQIVFSGSSTITVNNVFSTDFEAYEIEIQVISALADSGMTVNLRNAGVTDTTLANYALNYFEVSGAGNTATMSLGGNNGWPAGRSAVGGANAILRLNGPAHARKTFLQGESIDTANYRRFSSGFHGLTSTFDGFTLSVSGGGTAITGVMTIHGINNY